MRTTHETSSMKSDYNSLCINTKEDIYYAGPANNIVTERNQIKDKEVTKTVITLESAEETKTHERKWMKVLSIKKLSFNINFKLF